MKSSLAVVTLFALGCCGSLLANAQERIVSIYGWGDYIDPRVIEDFTRETGVKVTYDTFDSTVELEKRLAKGKSGFDIIIVPGEVLAREAGLFQKLDRSKLPNSKNLWPEVMARLQAFDPGNQHAVNYLWFTAGLTYNIDKIQEALGDGAVSTPLASWGDLLQVDHLKKLAGCGVSVLDSGEDMIAIALIYLKGDPANARWSDFKHAFELLNFMRRNVTEFDPAGYADALVSGGVCLAVGYSVDSVHARRRAQEADNGVEIGYTIPKEGTLIALDNLAILKDAPHAAEAYELIDFLLRPDVAARNTNFTGLASGVLAAKSAISKDIAEDEAVYPGPAAMQRLFVAPSYDPALQKAILREWAHIKTGK
jgi:putrescine transport system substrate-binding protein